jgi:hypothetical protein
MTYTVILALAAVAVAQEGTCVADDETCLLQTSVKLTTRSKGISRDVPRLSSRVFETLGKATAGKPHILQQALQALMSVPAMQHSKEAHKAMVRHHPVLKALVQKFPFIKEAIGQIEDPGLLHDLHVYMQSGSGPSTSRITGMKKNKKKWSKNGSLLSTIHKRLAKKSKREDTKLAVWYEGWGCEMNISMGSMYFDYEMPLVPQPCYGWPNIEKMTIADDSLYAILGNYSNDTYKYEIVVFFEDFESVDGGVAMIPLEDLGSQWPNGAFVSGEAGLESFFFTNTQWSWDPDTRISSAETSLLQASPLGVVNVSGLDFSTCSPGTLTGTCHDGACSLYVTCSPVNWPGNYTIEYIEVDTTSMNVSGQKSIISLEDKYPDSLKLVGDKLFWSIYNYDPDTYVGAYDVYSMSFGTDPKKEFTLPEGAWGFVTDGAILVTGKYEKWDPETSKSVYTLQAYEKKEEGWLLAREWSADGWSPGEIIHLPGEPGDSIREPSAQKKGEPEPESEEDEAPVVLPPGTYKVE